ncbi:undecaprenyldiphospho-muramoylpentapeptide beta-N-acetylglucosaminyltransferase [Marinobacter zhanjiangensis]|uniref:UDP-N-acetylglucosamine--N-acetylmuramyl-(pentapeptide) pyrophosphoryl-undecaprenol N-acetylglucosamine transferase n=1 Tax=Marinobacter zhanjiangensis TaxID=578215 RepID=A0ABQ3AYC4_9GAMM|nr:undecaprenyldiphospho-muramoylpentapeptide beta-N-acetylglucosaminyltransferase [Marinobacter zhanjiangensis]GGY68200.1 UDP-N-acetylglucosamine--N-acetylmuramyl-(pentapeptide) pyrophosphoryl-undecaprenol N-acetylglucosamine transferase [Marinobacter zhanjiangensis]
MTQRRFLVMAGGTGGHVFPALATARRLQELGHEVEWLGSAGGMEERLIADTDIPLSVISVSGLRGKGRLALLLAPFRLVRALWQSLRVMSRVKPDCVIGMGGFVTGPGGLSAWLTRRPLLVHEQNAVAGMTNRILVRFAETVMEAFPGSFGNGVVTRCTGNPVRSDVAAIPAPDERMAGRTGRVRVLVVGGSLGARAINERMPAAVARLAEEERPDVRHQCGERNHDAALAAYESAGVDASVEPFIKDMAEAYAWADLVVCRAGALTISELCAAGVGALLVPFPHAVDDHQTRNADYMVKAGAALLLPQHKLTDELLADTLADLLGDREHIIDMARAARTLARPDATERVVNYCLEAAHV